MQFMRILFLEFVVLLIFTVSCREKQNLPPKVTKGLMDVSRWDFNRDGIIPLDGDWEFYWEQLLSPDDLASKKISEANHYFPVPTNWNGYNINGKEIEGSGYGTFRLKVNGLRKGDHYALKFLTLGVSYKLWLDSNLVTEVGKVGTNKETTIPKMLTQTLEFTAINSSSELILQIANFHHRHGGPWNKIYLGTITDILKKRESSLLFDFFLMGSLIIMALYHFGLFLIRKKDQTSFYFGLFCLLFGLRVIFSEEKLIATWIPSASWEFLLKTENFLAFFSVVPFVQFCSKIFPYDFNQTIKKIFIAWILVVCLVNIFFPAPYFSYSEVIVDMGLPVLGVYPVYVFIVAIIRKRQGAWAILVGFIILFATVVNDTLYARSIIFTSYYLPFGLFCFIFSQSFILSLRFSQAFKESELLSDELKLKNEELTKLDKMKDEFLANTSHELKTPLHGIIGISESIHKGDAGKISEKVKRNLENITYSARRLNRMVENILDFSIIKNEKLRIFPRALDLNSIIPYCLISLDPLAKKKNLAMEYLKTEEAIYVYADEERLIQVFINLIGNAIKFTDKGKISISVSTDKSIAYISVADTGIGIDPDKIQEIFTPFVKGVNLDGYARSGAGLGLSITKELIELQGGTLEANSEVGKGSTFRFTLPMWNNKLSQAGQTVSSQFTESQNASLEGKPFNLFSEKFDLDIFENDKSDTSYYTQTKNAHNKRKQTILIADDDTLNIQILYNQLINHGYRVIITNNGEQALQKIAEIKPDLAILDVMMPVLNGWDVCKKIRETDSPLQLPIIILSARGREEDIVYGLKCGANDYLPKPFSEDELMARISLHLRIKSMNIELENSKKVLEVLNNNLENMVKIRTKSLNQKKKELEASNELKDKIYSIVAHDLKSPISSIRSYLHFKKSQMSSFSKEDCQKLIYNIISGIETSYSICDNSIYWANNQVEKINFQPININIIPTIKENISVLSFLAESKNVSLHFEEKNEIQNLKIDINLMNFVIRNLLTNAIKFSKLNGSVDISAIIQNEHFFLTISDRGVGMDARELAQIKKWEGGIKKEGTNKESGSGLGIILSKQFIAMHNGNLSIHSSKKNGTTVKVSIPIQ